jgi:hypothetical protein
MFATNLERERENDLSMLVLVVVDVDDDGRLRMIDYFDLKFPSSLSLRPCLFLPKEKVLLDNLDFESL